MAHFGAQIVYVMIFGRTHLRISLSWAKFDAEDDFDVRFPAAHQNPHQISKKQNFLSELFAEKKKMASKIQMSEIVWNAFCRSFAPIRAKFDEKTAVQSFEIAVAIESKNRDSRLKCQKNATSN